MLAHITNSPKTIDTGKPSEKTFSCGAARVITPNAMLTTSSAVTAGSASNSPLRNIHDAQFAMFQLASAPIQPRADRQVTETFQQDFEHRQMAIGGHEHQGQQQQEILRDDGDADTVGGIRHRRKAKCHLHRNHLRAEYEYVKEDLHHEADADSHQNLLRNQHRGRG